MLGAKNDGGLTAPHLPEYVLFGKRYETYYVRCAFRALDMMQYFDVEHGYARVIRLVDNVKHHLHHGNGDCIPLTIRYRSKGERDIKSAMNRAILAGERVRIY